MSALVDALREAAGHFLAAAFTLWGSPVTWLEIVAFVLAIWMVFCNMRVDPLAWPLAIVSSVLYGWLFAWSGLYGEALLQVVFVAVGGWGWWQWLRGHGQDGGLLKVHRLRPQSRWTIFLLGFATWPVIGALLDNFTDSTVPYLDALPTAGSLVGQFLLGRKLIENWPVWLAVNLVSLVLFGVKALWLTVLLYAIFAALSLVGWRAWRTIEGQVHA